MQNIEVAHAITKLSRGKKKYEEKKAKKLGYSSFYDYTLDKIKTKNYHLLKNEQSFETNTFYKKALSKEEVDGLLDHYENQRYSNAEKIAKKIIQEFPKLQIGYKVLGAVLRKTDRVYEALSVNQKSVQLVPQDIEAQFNLGDTYKKLGKLKESYAIFEKVESLKHSFTNAYNNLASTYKELRDVKKNIEAFSFSIFQNCDYANIYCKFGIIMHKQDKLGDAETFYRQAIALKPDYAQAYNNLGVIMQKYGKLNKAETLYSQAIAFNSNYAQAYCNLGIILQELGKFKEAETCYRRAIALKSNYAEAMLKLSIVLYYMNNVEETIYILEKIILIDTTNFGLRAYVLLAIFYYLKGNFQKSKNFLISSSQIKTKITTDFKNEKIYHRYLSKIINWHEDKNFDFYSETKNKYIYVIGESHSLNSHYLNIEFYGNNYFCQSMLIVGCKQWHLGNSYSNQYKNKFESIFCLLPKFSKVLLTIGEIDCRIDSGIIKFYKSYGKQLNQIIENTIENYLNYILKINLIYQHAIIIQGVPCPNINEENYSEKDVNQLIKVIKKFNNNLKSKSKEKGFGFLDVHKLTDRGDGFSNNKWHIDTYHLSPGGMLEAWKKHLC